MVVPQTVGYVLCSRGRAASFAVFLTYIFAARVACLLCHKVTCFNFSTAELCLAHEQATQCNNSLWCETILEMEQLCSPLDGENCTAERYNIVKGCSNPRNSDHRCNAQGSACVQLKLHGSSLDTADRARLLICSECCHGDLCNHGDVSLKVGTTIITPHTKEIVPSAVSLTTRVRFSSQTEKPMTVSSRMAIVDSKFTVTALSQVVLLLLTNTC